MSRPSPNHKPRAAVLIVGFTLGLSLLFFQSTGDAQLPPEVVEWGFRAEVRNKVQAALDAHEPRSGLAICNAVLQARPAEPSFYLLRAQVLDRLKSFPAALADVARAQALVQSSQSVKEPQLLVVRAGIHQHMGDYAQAGKDLLAAVNMDRGSPHALNNLAWLLAAAPDASARNPPASVQFALEAVGHSKADFNATDTLAVAYAATGNFDEAIRRETQAAEFAKKSKDAAEARESAKTAAERLQLFARHQPYRFARGE